MANFSNQGSGILSSISVTVLHLCAVLWAELEKRPLGAVSRTLLERVLSAHGHRLESAHRHSVCVPDPLDIRKTLPGQSVPLPPTALPPCPVHLPAWCTAHRRYSHMLSDLSQGQQASGCSLLWGVRGSVAPEEMRLCTWVVSLLAVDVDHPEKPLLGVHLELGVSLCGIL